MVGIELGGRGKGVGIEFFVKMKKCNRGCVVLGEGGMAPNIHVI